MGKVSEYRERLDRTLASPELTDVNALKTLVKNQILQSSLNENEGSSEGVIEKRTAEVSYFLDMLRSASLSDASKTTQPSCGEWKLKDDNEEYRVMYRQGPQGTPFHTLLVEGYVDGPFDTSLCISWESSLYRKWWPQISFPLFKITMCKCLQKVRIGEHISLLRVKVTWPLSTREAVLHYFLFEYLKDGLVVGLINTIPDLESIDKATHGYTKVGIPEAKDVVRIDLVGGFALQKVNSQRSYFRTIGTVDIKLDFVPPSLINFITRQLIGSGFKLYQKAVASVSNYDEDYSKALEDSMYARIQEALCSMDEPKDTMEKKELKDDVCLPSNEHSMKDMQKSLVKREQNVQVDESPSESILKNVEVMDEKDYEIEVIDENEESQLLNGDIRGTEQNVHSNGHVIEILQKTGQATDRKTFGEIVEEDSEDGVDLDYGETFVEIEEEDNEDSADLDDGDKNIGQPLTYNVAQKSPVPFRKSNIPVSPEVERALETLEKAISLVREHRFNSLAKFSSVLITEETPKLQKIGEKDSSFVEDGGVSSETGVSVEVAEKGGTVERISHESRNSSSNGVVRCRGSNSLTREMNHNKIAPASPEHYLSIPSESNQVLRSSKDGIAELTIMDRTWQEDNQMSIEVNNIHENSLREKKKLSRREKHILCCSGLKGLK